MSLGEDGKQIHCDGEGCLAVTFLPIALHPQWLPSNHRAPTAAGWLFISGIGDTRHFCTLCAVKQLDRVVGPNPKTKASPAQRRRSNQVNTASESECVPLDEGPASSYAEESQTKVEDNNVQEDTCLY